MKKVLLALTAVLGVSAFALLTASCGGGGGGGSDDYEAPVTENGITGSEVFIAGRTVEIWANWCSDHEVTQAEYWDVMRTTPSSSYGVGDDYPVYNVSWYDALIYCNKRSIDEHRTPCYKISGKTNPSEWGTVPTSNNETWNAVTCDFTANGYRLPTEAEWEYFARGGNTSNSGQTTYSGSNTIGDFAWYVGNSENMTHEVMSKEPNALGLYDMSGNVWEWCWDRDLYRDIEVSTPSSGAITGDCRVIRGGCCLSDSGCCSVSYRFGGSGETHGHTVKISPDWHYAGFYSINPDAIRGDDLLGFRVVRSTSD